MSVQGFSDSAMKSLEKISSMCKDKHSYLKTCCSFVISELRKDSALSHLTPDERANMVFYPLKIASETREENFVIPSIDSIQKMIAHGVVDSTYLYKSPDVPIPPKKKTFTLFSGNDTPPSQTPKNEKEENIPLIQVVVNSICMNSVMPSEEVQLLVVRALLTAVSTAKCEVHGGLLLLCIRTTCDIFLQAKVLPAQTSAKASLSQMIGTVQLKLESEDPGAATLQSTLAASEEMDETTSVTSSDAPEGAADRDDGLQFTSVNERDCFLILRSLCKLSTKSSDSNAADSAEMRSKILSLTLLFHLVANMGPNFSSRPSFTTAIHKYLCVTLLHNFMSSVAEVTRLSANILLKLLLEHREKLKSKIAIFFINVVFPLLDSSNASFAHRSAVLTLLEKFMSDGQAVADIFVNFDCAFSAPNLYNLLINRLTKVVQTSHVVPNWITPAQDQALKLQAAKGVSAHVASLADWVKTQQEALRAQHDLRGDSEEVVAGAEFDRMIKGKKAFEAVLDVFKKKAKDGIAVALQAGLIKEETPSEVAQFLLTKGLDKVKIGEYLAQNNPFVKEVMREFIHMNDFTGLDIDEAMRVFLGKFKIFGEAEVVDRTMDTFAEKYCSQNPDAFSSAGTAYILAFSIMMLNTDAHSVHVKSKMSLPEFIRNNRGIDDGKDLPQEMMEAIYQRITTKEIKLEGEGAPAASAGSPVRHTSTQQQQAQQEDSIFVSLEKKKQMGYKTETEQLMQQSMHLISADDNADDVAFVTATGTEVAAAMWDAAWTPVLPALSVPMEESNDEGMIDSCLYAFDRAMEINCYFSMATERNAFISSLLAFTHLTSFREIHYKNVKSITTLIRIASREGNALESSWYEILRCISWLDKLHLISGAQQTRLEHTVGGEGNRGSMTQRAAELKKVEQHNAEIIANNVDQVDVDRIFSRSGELEGRAVVDLVEALCKVSAEELQENPRPRTYSLQKLVEVAEINIGRLRYVWSQMWQHLSKHFISVGLDKQQLVAMFVVDNLRQLAMKFLQRDELGNFNFQRDFLKPFEVIASQTKRPEIHELIIASLGQMVDARARNIMSGWKIVLNTLGRCATDTHRSVVLAAANVLERITMNQSSLLGTPELLTEAANAWSQFGSNTVDASLALRSIKYIRLFAVFAAQGIPTPQHALFHVEVPAGDEESDAAKAPKRTVDDILRLLEHGTELIAADSANVVTVRSSDSSAGYDLKLWLTIFAALSSLSGVPDLDTRSAAITTLFTIVRQHGAIFSESDWQMILGGTIYPIFENLLCDLGELFDEAHHDALAKVQYDCQLGLLAEAMKSTIAVFCEFHDVIGSQKGEMLEHFVNCGKRNDPNVIALGFQRLHDLIDVMDGYGHADVELWYDVETKVESLTREFSKILEAHINRPVGVQDNNTTLPLLQLQCVAQCMGRLLLLSSAPESAVRTFTTLLRETFLWTAAILANPESVCILRDHYSTRAMDCVQMLIDVEHAVCSAYIAALPALKSFPSEKKLLFLTEREMMDRLVLVSLTPQSSASHAEAVMLRDVSSLALKGMENMENSDDFSQVVEVCYESLCRQIPLCIVELNRVIAELMLKIRREDSL